MSRLRVFANDYLLPLVIGALVLRALIPVGFMPGSHAGISLTAALCNAPVTGNPPTEIIEIPGADTPASAGALHCDFCLQPVWGAAGAAPVAGAPAAVDTVSIFTREDAPAARFALARAQIPRAPPLA